MNNRSYTHLAYWDNSLGQLEMRGVSVLETVQLAYLILENCSDVRDQCSTTYKRQCDSYADIHTLDLSIMVSALEDEWVDMSRR